ncbi:MAG: phosphoserine phosphatase SerB [Pseudomonadota bacterium]
MDLVVTLVAADRLDPAVAAQIVQALGADEAVRLSDRATDVYATGSCAEVRATVASTLGEEPVDAIVQSAKGRQKSLLVSDMDSTMIEQECIDELAGVLGLKEKVADITARAMAGELDFGEALTERVALLAGIEQSAIADVLATIRPSKGAKTLIATLRAHGVRTVLVSGGFSQFAEPIGEKLGFDAAFANHLIVGDGALTGDVAQPILGADAKRERLEKEAATLGVTASAAVALGDGANDLEMIDAAGLGIAYRAKPAVAKAADAQLRHADLTAVLYAMGIPQDRFVTDGD